MTRAFADTAYFLALLNDADEWHSQAIDAGERCDTLVTTAWVIFELADGYCRRARRSTVIAFLRGLRRTPDVEIVPPDAELYEAGFDLFCRRGDKDWSLTDCVSFLVMERAGLQHALTPDRHFEQAGFTVLLK